MQDPRNVPTGRMVENILAVWHGANRAERHAGALWYHDAHDIAEELAEAYGTSVDVTAAVISALSPSNRWSRNVADAEALLQAHAAGLDPSHVSVSTYGPNKAKAWALIQGDLAPEAAFSRRAQKTGSFSRLIADPDSPDVVIDGHALCIAMGERRPIGDVPALGIRAYQAVAKAYREAAARLGVAPHVVQATTWVAWRNLHVPEHQR